MTNALDTARAIALSNANAAFDQAGDFSSLLDAIASYWDNACDTLVEEGIASDECHAEMERAFEERIAALSAAK
jgi:hypothetical protein